MTKMLGNDSKAALAQQRAEVRRSAYGKQHIGEDGGSAAARQAMRERVHRMQEAHANQRAEQLSQEPLVSLVVHLAADSISLVLELLRLPKRLLQAALGRRQSQEPA